MGMLTQNSKMRKSGIWGFGLMPGMTCCKCSVNCYAAKGCYMTYSKTMFKHWDANLELTSTLGFPLRMYDELKKKRNLKYVRIHTEGDFYNQEYLDKWSLIAFWRPDIQFYAYTKRLDLDYSGCPSNMKIIQSFGGEFDHLIDLNKPHAFIFDSEADLIEDGYAAAYDDDTIAADPATIKIGLVAH